MGIHSGVGHLLEKSCSLPPDIQGVSIAKFVIIASNRPWWKDRESVKLNQPMERWSVQYLYYGY